MASGSVSTVNESVVDGEVSASPGSSQFPFPFTHPTSLWESGPGPREGSGRTRRVRPRTDDVTSPAPLARSPTRGQSRVPPFEDRTTVRSGGSVR